MAHGVRAAAGEADELCILARLLKYDLLHPAEIGKIRLFTLIDGVIVVRCAVDADGVAAPGDLADAPGVILIAVRHEKRRLDAIGIQNIQKMLRIGGRPVVKREIDRSASGVTVSGRSAAVTITRRVMVAVMPSLSVTE